MVKKCLTFEQKKALLSAFETINGNGYLPFDPDEVKKFIDSVFLKKNLKLVWKTPGFPFTGLNSIYKSLTGNSHPVFRELLEYSFISGNFNTEEKEEAAGGNFSAAAVRYFGFRDSPPVTSPGITQA